MFQWFFIFIIVHFYISKSEAQVKCYNCDSSKLIECATDPQNINLPFEACESLLYKCAISIVGQITYRGCTNKVPLPNPNPLYYRTCDTNLCNDLVFPPGRLKCHQCKGENCVGLQDPNNKNILKPCRHFEENDSCYIDVIDEANAIRNCVSTFPNVTNQKNVIFCDYNACNNENGIKNLTCVQCNNDRTNCVRVQPPTNPLLNCTLESNNGKCNVNYLLGRPDETCYIYHRFNKFSRGCTQLVNDHTQLDEDYLSICNGDNCNKMCANYTKCISCDSKTNLKCKNDANDLKPIACTLEESSCYATIFENGDVMRGCGTPKNFIDTYHCQTDKCNAKPFQKCYKCNSKSDSNCAQWIDPTKIEQSICESPDDMCIIAIHNDGSTERGCKTFNKLDCINSNLSTCKNCTGNLCNSGIFPESRLKCHQCKGSTDCSKLQENIDKIQPCIWYHKNDKCFEYSNRELLMFRGCYSDQSVFQKECVAQKENCLQCNEIGCNYHQVTTNPKLNCYKCSDKENPIGSCGWAQPEDKLIKCKSLVMFYSTELCYDRNNSLGEISRGCSLDENICLNKNNENGCNTCMTDKCNRNSLEKQMCVQCRSNVTGQVSCGSSAEGIKARNCKTVDQFFRKRGCFTKVEVNKVVTRGCAFDLNDLEFNDCIQVINKICKYCDEQSCNYIKAPEYEVINKNNSGIGYGGDGEFNINLIILIFLYFLL